MRKEAFSYSFLFVASFLFITIVVLIGQGYYDSGDSFTGNVGTELPLRTDGLEVIECNVNADGIDPSNEECKFELNSLAKDYARKTGRFTVYIARREGTVTGALATGLAIHTPPPLPSIPSPLPSSADLSGKLIITPDISFRGNSPATYNVQNMRACEQYIMWLQVTTTTDMSKPFIAYIQNSLGFAVGRVYDPLQTTLGYYPSGDITEWVGIPFRYAKPTTDTVKAGIDHTFNGRPVQHRGMIIPSNNIQETNENNNFPTKDFTTVGTCNYPWRVGQAAAYDTTRSPIRVRETLKFLRFNIAQQTIHFTDSRGNFWSAPLHPIILHKNAVLTAQPYDGRSQEIGVAYTITPRRIVHLNPDLDGDRSFTPTRLRNGIHYP